MDECRLSGTVVTQILKALPYYYTEALIYNYLLATARFLIHYNLKKVTQTTQKYFPWIYLTMRIMLVSFADVWTMSIETASN